MSLVIVPKNLKYEIKPDMECHLGKLTLQTMKRFRQKLFQVIFSLLFLNGIVVLRYAFDALLYNRSFLLSK